MSASRFNSIVFIVLVTSASFACTPPGEPREVLIAARGMTFILVNDSDTPNPIIRLRAGERVRLVLRNEAPGLLHDFAIPAWDVQTEQIRAGQSTDVIFTVPSTPGRTGYSCRPHAKLMNGHVEVTP